MISTHALREEGDGLQAGRDCRHTRISTHALREEGDAALQYILDNNTGFLPTPSARRATMYILQSLTTTTGFLPTPSARRATSAAAQTAQTAQISTHALREEGDGQRLVLAVEQHLFLPTPSARRATPNIHYHYQ